MAAGIAVAAGAVAMAVVTAAASGRGPSEVPAPDARSRDPRDLLAEVASAVQALLRVLTERADEAPPPKTRGQRTAA